MYDKSGRKSVGRTTKRGRYDLPIAPKYAHRIQCSSSPISRLLVAGTSLKIRSQSTLTMTFNSGQMALALEV